MDDFYDFIMEHSTSSSNKKEIDNPTSSSHGFNPSCGDEINLEIKLSDDKKTIEDLSFTGHGCAVSQASTSIMIDTLRGKTIEEAREIVKTFIGMIKREITSEDELKKLEDAIVLKDLSIMPARTKCALLAWHTLENMIN